MTPTRTGTSSSPHSSIRNILAHIHWRRRGIYVVLNGVSKFLTIAFDDPERLVPTPPHHDPHQNAGSTRPASRPEASMHPTHTYTDAVSGAGGSVYPFRFAHLTQCETSAYPSELIR